MSRLLAAQRALTLPGWIKEDLSRKAQAIPSLDLRFAEGKSLVDATTGANLITFTRASSGTFVGSDGVLRTATTNLLLRSEEFNDASWVKTGLTVTANSDASPDGQATADTLTISGSNQSIYQSATVTASTSYTGSVYVKLGTLIAANYKIAVYDNTNAAFIVTDVVPAQTPTSTGWTRISYTFTTPATCTSVRWYPYRNSANVSGTVFAWGAQLEQSATVGEYIPTTSTINSAPRFDHNPTTGESLGLLVEEQRTNLLQRSEEFDNAYWTKNGSTISANSAVSPDGLTTADKLVEDTLTGNHRVFAATPSQAASTAHSLSVYVKAAGRTVVRVELRDSLGGYAVQDFNLTTLAVTSAGSGTGTISSVGNGWYRCTVTGTSSASGGVGTVLFWALAVAGTTSYTGDGTSGLFLWGAQLEAGAFPTSYIPTTAATATRSADVASITGSSYSSWASVGQGTIFANAMSADPSGVFPCAASINDTTTSNRIQIGRTNTSTAALRVFVTSGGATTVNGMTVGSTSALQLGRVAFAYATDDFGGAANGTLATPDTSGAVPVTTQLQIGNAVGSGSLNGCISRLTYWPVRLGNNVLQQITQ